MPKAMKLLKPFSHLYTGKLQKSAWRQPRHFSLCLTLIARHINPKLLMLSCKPVAPASYAFAWTPWTVKLCFDSACLTVLYVAFSWRLIACGVSRYCPPGDWMAEARIGATDMFDRIARLPGLQKT